MLTRHKSSQYFIALWRLFLRWAWALRTVRIFYAYNLLLRILQLHMTECCSFLPFIFVFFISSEVVENFLCEPCFSFKHSVICIEIFFALYKEIYFFFWIEVCLTRTLTHLTFYTLNESLWGYFRHEVCLWWITRLLWQSILLCL